MKIIVAADSFKGSLSAQRACNIIADTLTEQLPNAHIIVKPMADGGEGTAKAMIAACDGKWVSQKVMGPLPDMQVDAGFAWFDNSRTALVEMACASGITLLSNDQLDPVRTTTYGTGQLIKTAIEKQPREILLAIGGSATVDMGIGAAMALGWKFLDNKKRPVGLGGGELEKIENIISPTEKFHGKIKVLSDVDNPLYGPNGAAEVFAPQKGADVKMVKKLDLAIRQLSDLVKAQLGIDVSNIPGAGAAGGLGAGAIAFMNAEMVSGIETIIDVSNLKEDMENADWIITGEGKFDSQSLQGKVISGIIRSVRQTNADTKIVIIAGDVRLNKSEYGNLGIVDAIGLKNKEMTTEYAIRNCEKLLTHASHEFVKKYLKPQLQ